MESGLVSDRLGDGKWSREDAEEKTADKGPLPEHENVRGAHYYH
ncbi:hypothetical protein [Corallococcus macrosporus]|uniref:Uncharacterized protein n=1 Tax=Myxococcus fulvus (strain ATCC BAA-855 / HW-1) TaxID=483219 RepID=F8CDN4_MYXFH|nr:hypothetical protein [Corallococcus macrosporus]AEI68524.1 hypothetical protein LILAB_33215 [Corallococcus macrosporus]